MSAEFCDTNVLVYVYDSSAGEKRDRAQALVDRLWESGTGAVSVQVLQEFYVGLTRKIPRPLSTDVARRIVADYGAWQVVAPGHGDIMEAIDLSIQAKISFWDAMVVIAAHRAAAQTLWTEDLNDGQVYGEATARNPFSGLA